MASAATRTKIARARTPLTSQGCRARSDECERLAMKDDNTAVREDLLRMAATWRRFADEHEDQPKPGKLTSDSPTLE